MGQAERRQGERSRTEVSGNGCLRQSTSHQREQIRGVSAAQAQELSGSKTYFEIAFEKGCERIDFADVDGGRFVYPNKALFAKLHEKIA
jgi:hypothetical protein